MAAARIHMRLGDMFARRGEVFVGNVEEQRPRCIPAVDVGIPDDGVDPGPVLVKG